MTDNPHEPTIKAVFDRLHAWSNRLCNPTNGPSPEEIAVTNKILGQISLVVSMANIPITASYDGKTVECTCEYAVCEVTRQTREMASMPEPGKTGQSVMERCKIWVKP